MMQAEATTARRRAYMVLSPHALPYAKTALRTLVANSAEALDLQLITDSVADKQALCEAMESLQPEARHAWAVTAEDELADAEATAFAKLPNLRAFRHGHPCWRKITDPVLMGKPGDELILLDPDLYFPNRFRFEPAPESGVLLMWQQPNCLLPSHVVRAAMTAGIPLARHVDIGVAHWRLSDDLGELEWMEWLLGKLGGASLPRAMHVEAIVWAALGMHVGGGYLDPKLWVCWRRSQGKRLARKLGVAGTWILRGEPWTQMKCFHAGGEAKWWLADAEAADVIVRGANAQRAGEVVPFVELTPTRYEKEQAAKGMLAGLGYYRLFDAGRS
jgi:hypothetical protein